MSNVQVSEEGEIALEEGEIEGEVLQEPPPKSDARSRHGGEDLRDAYGARGYRGAGEDGYGYRGPSRGRGRGRGDWGRGPGHGNMYPAW